MELSFHVPTTNTTYVGDEERPSAQVDLRCLRRSHDLGACYWRCVY